MKAPKPKSFDPVPKGSHVARLYQIVHIGTTEFEYMGETKKSDKIRLTFELCNERKSFVEGDEPKPFSVSREFGWTMGKKGKLRPFVEGMLGTALHDEEAYNMDIEDLLGRECLLSVVHEEKNGSLYANIHSASPLPRGMKAPEIFNETSFIDVDSTDEAIIAQLPEFLRNKIWATEEWGNRMKYKQQMEGIRQGRDIAFEEEEASPKNFRPRVAQEPEIDVDPANV